MREGSGEQTRGGGKSQARSTFRLVPKASQMTGASAGGTGKCESGLCLLKQERSQRLGRPETDGGSNLG